MTSKHQWLTDLIKEISARYIAEGAADSLIKINSGLCGDLSHEVICAVGSRHAYEIGLTELGVDNFLTPSEDGFIDGNPFDRDLITKHWPNFLPPAGLDWDLMDRISADACFDPGTHVWLSIDGQHFDAEAPEGVDSPFELPFFKRVIDGWIAEFMPSPAAPSF